jgi:hypothetical protein
MAYKETIVFDRVIKATPDAMLFRFEDRNVWLPFSEIEFTPIENEIEVSAWLIDKHDLDCYIK